MLLSERGLGGNDADLELRLRRWRGEKGKRAEAARGLARRWLAPRRAEGRNAARSAPASLSPSRTASRSAATPRATDWLSAGGRGFRLDPASPLAREQWLAVAEVGGVASGARILAAAADRPGDGREPVRRPDRNRHRARLRSRHRHGPRLARPPARRDPALGRPGQPRRPRRDRGGAARRRPRARPRPAALERCRPVAAHPRRLRPPPRSVDPRSFRRSAARHARRLAAAAARRQAPARRGRSRRADRLARRPARLGGPQGGRPARARPFRDPGRQPPRDRL